MSDAVPAFEMRTLDGRVMAVWANGHAEGFPLEYTIRINRIPNIQDASFSEGYAYAKTGQREGSP